MNICFYYRTEERPWGGANSFLRGLWSRLKKTPEISLTSKISSRNDILFLNSAYKAPGKMFNIYDFIIIDWFRKKGAKVVHRLDGLRQIYTEKESRMDKLQLKIMHKADMIIFQSHYSFESFRKFGYNGNKYKIIYNGVDTDIFNMKNKHLWNKKGPLKIISCSWSPNPNKGHKIIAECSSLKDVEVSFIGNWAEGIGPKKVKMYGVLTRKEISQIFKGYHVLLFPSLNESCSNVLIEGLSSGLPVLYIDSGSNKEIAYKYGVNISEYNKLSDPIYILKDKYTELTNNIYNDSYKFSLKYAANLYIKAFKEVLDDWFYR